MTKRNPLTAVAWAVCFLLFVSLPFIISRYQINLLTEIIIFALYGVTYNLLLGYGGMLSFGHAMFFGIGAYTAGILLTSMTGTPFWAVVVCAFVITALAGFLVGSLLLKVKGTPFALLTLAFNSLFFAIAFKWYAVTGGDDGLSIKRPDINLGLWTLDASDVGTFYYITLIVLSASILACWHFTRTAMGQTVLLMRENENRMQFIGYNTAVARLILFTFTACFAGLAGAFYTLHFRFVSVDAISVGMTTTVLLLTFIGGTGHFAGPLVGSAFFIYLQDYLSEYTDRWPFFMGFIFIVMVMYAPGGVSGIILSGGKWLRKLIRPANHEIEGT
jgi:branched-chain amino acid transport system permease protein